MKKYINKDNLKPILIIIVLIIFQTIFYFSNKLIQGPPIVIGSKYDKVIPFIELFVIFYCIWFIFLFFIPLIIYNDNKKTFIRYCLSYILIVLISNLIFAFYPTTIIRPEPKFIITKLIYLIDSPPVNCFPSLHCALSMLWILYIIELRDINLKNKIIYITLCITIIASTLFIKQHVIIDVISGIIIAIIPYYLIKLLNVKY